MKRIVALLAGFLICGTLFAQEPWEVNEESKFKDRLIFGGNFGLSFGNVTFVEISPRVGYRMTNRWILGVGGTYRYRKDKRFVPDLKTSDYALNVFTRHNIYGPLFAHAEYEYLNYEFVFQDINTGEIFSERASANSIFVGGGLAQPLGNRSVLLIEALYNLSYENSPTYPYADPWLFRVGFGIGL